MVFPHYDSDGKKEAYPTYLNEIMNGRTNDTDPSEDRVNFGRLAFTTGFLVRRLNNLLSTSWSDDTTKVKTKITSVQAGLMILIDQNPNVIQAQLLKALDIEGPTLVRSVSRLVDLGLVEKNKSNTDKRAFLLNLTQAGKQTLNEIEKEMTKRDQALEISIDPKDMETFRRVTKMMILKLSRNAQSGNLDGLLHGERGLEPIKRP